MLAALQRLGGRARPLDVAAEMRTSAVEPEPRGSTGWRKRAGSGGTAASIPIDHRAVEVELTRRGRNLWREMNVTYRRAVQQHFANVMADTDIAAVHRVVDLLTEPTTSRHRPESAEPLSRDRRTSPRSRRA